MSLCTLCVVAQVFLGSGWEMWQSPSNINFCFLFCRNSDSPAQAPLPSWPGFNPCILNYIITVTVPRYTGCTLSSFTSMNHHHQYHYYHHHLIIIHPRTHAWFHPFSLHGTILITSLFPVLSCRIPLLRSRPVVLCMQSGFSSLMYRFRVGCHTSIGTDVMTSFSDFRHIS